MGLFGGILGAVGSLAGGLLGLQSQRESAANAENLNRLNYEHQKEFAQNGIRWRVADAKAAGLHPLAALGAQSSGYTPSAVIGDSPDFSFLQDVGQNIGRAIDAKRTQAERAELQEMQNALFNEELRGRQLQNEETQTRIDSMKWDMAMQAARNAEQSVRTQQQVPAMPSLASDGSLMSGQGNATSPGGIEIKPAEIVVNEPGRLGQERGSVSELGFTRTNDGGYAPVMSKDAKDRLDDDFIGSSLWHFRNSLPAAFDVERVMPPRSWLPKGSEWRFDVRRGAFYPVPSGSGFFYHTERDLTGPFRR